MLIKILSFILVLSVCEATWAQKKEALFLGGGGEPAGTSTIFDPALENFADFSLRTNWKMNVLFDGGHSESEKTASLVTGGKNKSATVQNLNNEINSYIQRMQSGDLKAGDQLLVQVASHGATNKPGQSSHSVAALDGDFDLDSLKKLRDLAEKKGVKLAILDYSCYSGSSIGLATDKTCVMSVATPDNLGYASSGSEISKNLKPGENLEDVFIKSRTSQLGNPGLPQISTEAGRKAYEATKFITQSTLERISFDQSMKSQAEYCDPLGQQTFGKLSNELKAINKGVADATTDKDLLQLKSALQGYKKSQAQAAKHFKYTKELDVRTCGMQSDGGEICGTFTQFQYGHKLLLEKQKAGAKIQDELEAYNAVMGTPEYSAWQEDSSKYKELSTVIYEDAAAVVSAEKQIYNNLYKKYSAESKTANACKDFVL